MAITREEWDALSLDRRRKIIDAVMTVEVVPLHGKKDAVDQGVKTKVRTSTGRFGWTMPQPLARELAAAVS